MKVLPVWRLQGLQRTRVSLPVQQTQALARGEADVFEQDGHCPDIITIVAHVQLFMRRSGQFLIRGSEIRRP